MAIIGSGVRHQPGHAVAPIGHHATWLERVAAGARAALFRVSGGIEESSRVSEFRADAETQLGRQAGGRC